MATGDVKHKRIGPFIFRDYRTGWGEARTFKGVVHDGSDNPTELNMNFLNACVDIGLEDGDEFVVVVRRTGNRPYGDRKWLLNPTDEEEDK